MGTTTKTQTNRHPFAEQTGSLVCATCGMTRGSVRHSRLGSNRYMGTTKETTMDRYERDDWNDMPQEPMTTTIPLTTTDVDGREWMTIDLIHRLEEDAADVRQQLAELQDAFQMLMVNVRNLPGGQGLWDRVDAYPGIRLDRDMGAGQGADGWIREVSTFLEDLEAVDRGDPERVNDPHIAAIAREQGFDY